MTDPRTATDAANLAGLLRREPALCTTCASEMLVLTLGRTIDAVTELAKTVAVEQETTRCPRCDQVHPVVSLAAAK